MNLNATLLGQMITFAIFVWFTMKYVWPPVMNALQERQKKIADGLAAAEKGERALEEAQVKADDQFKQAKIEAADILEQAHQRATQIIEDSKHTARIEGERIVALAKSDVEQQMLAARQALREQVADLAVNGAQKILAKEIDKSAHQKLLDELMTEI